MTLNETPLDPIAAIDQSYAALMRSLDSLEERFNRGFWIIMCLMGVKLAVILAMLGVIISRLP